MHTARACVHHTAEAQKLKLLCDPDGWLVNATSAFLLLYFFSPSTQHTIPEDMLFLQSQRSVLLFFTNKQTNEQTNKQTNKQTHKQTKEGGGGEKTKGSHTSRSLLLPPPPPPSHSFFVKKEVPQTNTSYRISEEFLPPPLPQPQRECAIERHLHLPLPHSG